MFTLTATFDAAALQTSQSLLDLIIIWYLLVLLEENAARCHKRRIKRQKRSHDAQRAQEAKRRKRQLPFRPGF